MTDTPKIQRAIKRSEALLALAGLTGWKVETFKDYHRFGNINHIAKRLSYNERFIQRCTEDEFDRVTIHEIAHALVGPGNGHNKKFVEVCRKLSKDDPIDTCEFDVKIHRYDLKCPECGAEGSTNDNRTRYCGTCLVPFKRSKFNLPTVEWATIP